MSPTLLNEQQQVQHQLYHHHYQHDNQMVPSGQCRPLDLSLNKQFPSNSETNLASGHGDAKLSTKQPHQHNQKHRKSSRKTLSHTATTNYPNNNNSNNDNNEMIARKQTIINNNPNNLNLLCNNLNDNNHCGRINNLLESSTTQQTSSDINHVVNTTQAQLIRNIQNHQQQQNHLSQLPLFNQYQIVPDCELPHSQSRNQNTFTHLLQSRQQQQLKFKDINNNSIINRQTAKISNHSINVNDETTSTNKAAAGRSAAAALQAAAAKFLISNSTGATAIATKYHHQSPSSLTSSSPSSQASSPSCSIISNLSRSISCSSPTNNNNNNNNINININNVDVDNVAHNNNTSLLLSSPISSSSPIFESLKLESSRCLSGLSSSRNNSNNVVLSSTAYQPAISAASTASSIYSFAPNNNNVKDFNIDLVDHQRRQIQLQLSSHLGQQPINMINNPSNVNIVDRLINNASTFQSRSCLRGKKKQHQDKSSSTLLKPKSTGKNRTVKSSSSSTSSLSSSPATFGGDRSCTTSPIGKNLRAHLCNQCGRSFSRSDMLTRHSRLHSGLKPYQCSKCHQVFSRSDHLSTHERTHTGEKPFQCEHCSYSACRRDMITRHMRTHTNGGTASAGTDKLQQIQQQQEPQLDCPQQQTQDQNLLSSINMQHGDGKLSQQGKLVELMMTS